MQEPAANTVEFVDWRAKAKEKIDAEDKAFRGGRKEQVIHTHVARTLRAFCDEEPHFAEVLVKTKRTLSECCAYIVDGSDNALSDLEAYRRAVQFYFPHADVEFKMLVRLTGTPPTKAEMAEPAKVKVKDNPPAPQKSPAKATKKSKQGKDLEKTQKAQKPAKTPDKPGRRKKQEQQADDYMQLSLWG